MQAESPSEISSASGGGRTKRQTEVGNQFFRGLVSLLRPHPSSIVSRFFSASLSKFPHAGRRSHSDHNEVLHHWDMNDIERVQSNPSFATYRTPLEARDGQDRALLIYHRRHAMHGPMFHMTNYTPINGMLWLVKEGHRTRIMHASSS